MKPILTAADMRHADALAIASGIPETRLMERAGRAVADAAMSLLDGSGQPHRTLVLCGPGNNGGDGYVAARVLAGRGVAVDVAPCASSLGVAGTAGSMAALWEGPLLTPDAADPACYHLVIDAVFGAGLSRDLGAELIHLLERVAASGAKVLAVDVPSGLDADTGQVRGAAAQADVTVTFAARKPGHLLQPGRGLCGKLVVADIGIVSEQVIASGSRLWCNEPALWLAHMPVLSVQTHKYRRGHAVVLSGAAGHSGAARLAARAALRAGAGLVTLFSPADAMAENAAQLSAVMLRLCDDPDELAALLADERIRAVLIGPGGGVGERMRHMVAAAATMRRPMVLDADALTSYSGRLRQFADDLVVAAPAGLVLTPHEGEFARLFADAPEVLQPASKVERARAAACLTGAVILLKGADTVIAAPDGSACIAQIDAPWLATAGSGDVLAGIIAGLLAQGMPAFPAASAAVWLHGRAGAAFGPGLIAEDLPESLPEILRELL